MNEHPALAGATDLSEVFEAHADFDPLGDFHALLKLAPARWVVYLLADAQDHPVQLLCVKNLRASLKRRLGLPDPASEDGQANGLSRRVNYRDLVRRIHWKRVDSAFEADLIYYEAARRLFKQSYRGMVGFRPAWFVHVDFEARFPRFVKTIDLGARTGLYLGPLEDKHAAARLIELLIDAFDLCRYHNILVQAPNAKACAYKEMGRCPAPCDGSISMGQYRRLAEWGTYSAIEPEELIRQNKARMQEAAANLCFESAVKIKAYVDSLSKFGAGVFRHVRQLSDFNFISIQRGPRAQTAKVFLIHGGNVEETAGLIGDPAAGGSSSLMREWLERFAVPAGGVDPQATERIGIVTHHLFSSKRDGGTLLRASELEERSLSAAYREIVKQAAGKAASASWEEDEGSEGLVKELQSLA